MELVNDKSNVNYDVGNEVMYNTEVLKSNLYDYNDAYVLVRGDIIITAHNNPSLVAFKIEHHLLSVSQKLMEQQHMTLKT